MTTNTKPKLILKLKELHRRKHLAIQVSPNNDVEIHIDTRNKFLDVAPYSDYIKTAINSFYPMREALENLIKDGECYCLNPGEAMGRNPCGFCKGKEALKLANSEEM